MRVVYTYWSTPRKFGRGDLDRWALSSGLSKRHYGDIHLVTDSGGLERLEPVLENFTSVSQELDFFDSVDKAFWAAGKLLTYSLQEEPFLHLDDDVFLFKPLPEEIVGAAIFAQSPEVDGRELDYYVGCIQHFDAVDVEKVTLPLDQWSAYNAGIIGGSDLGFFKRYAREAIEWGYDMTIQGKAHYKGMTLMEQAFFAKKAREEGKDVTCLLEHRTDPKAASLGYTHLVDSKFRRVIRRRVNDRLKKEFPRMYNKLQAL